MPKRRRRSPTRRSSRSCTLRAKKDPKPTAPASAGTQVQPPTPRRPAPRRPPSRAPARLGADRRASARSACSPTRRARRAAGAGGEQQFLRRRQRRRRLTTSKRYFTGVYGLKRTDVVLKQLKAGAQVIAGTILGRIGRTRPKHAPHMRFEVRPAGRGAPRIDPKPILDGWKLLESTAIYRAAGKNPFVGPDATTPSIGQILLMSKETLQQRVLADPRDPDLRLRPARHPGRRRSTAACWPRSSSSSASGLNPTVTALRVRPLLPDHARATSPSTPRARAVDIAAINGIPILGHQGPGSITDITIRRLLTLQGTMKPHQIISLMTFHGADNTLSLPDHDDHIHVGFHPLYGTNASWPAAQRGPQAQPVGQADRPPRQDRQPDRPDQAVEVRDQGSASGPARPTSASSAVRLRPARVPRALGPARRPLRAARARRRDRARGGGLHARARPNAGAARPPPATRLPRPGAGHHRARHPGHRAALRRPGRRRALAARGRRGRGPGSGGHPEPRAAHAARRRPPIRTCASCAASRRSSCARASARATRWPTGAGSSRARAPVRRAPHPPRGRAASPGAPRRAARRPRRRPGVRGARAARAPGRRCRAPSRGRPAARRGPHGRAGRARAARARGDLAAPPGRAARPPGSSRPPRWPRFRAASRTRTTPRSGTACSAWKPLRACMRWCSTRPSDPQVVVKAVRAGVRRRSPAKAPRRRTSRDEEDRMDEAPP